MSSTSALLLASLTSGPASAAVGGPDAFGWYSYADQDDGAVYNYVDITATGMLVVSGAEVTAFVPMPVPFQVYNHTVTGLVANTNGFLTTDIGSNFDASNDCMLPDPPSTGEGFRIYALHDDLNTDVFYQYFDAAAAAAVGFPGTTNGVSIFQWSGVHDATANPVDAEAVLFHDTFDILTMVAADGEGGVGSTLGIQNDQATAGLEYTCDVAGSVIPGSTAVLYTLGPDSDCCSASAEGVGGCLNAPCQATACGIDPFCCNTEWDTTCADNAVMLHCPALCAGVAPPLVINEIRIDQPFTDNDEYAEIAGPPGTSLDGFQYIVIGDAGVGEIEEVLDLTGQVIPPSGYFVIGEAAMTIGVPDVTASINFENLDTTTHMLVSNLTASEFSNLDADQDGVLDFVPWDMALDTVAMISPTSADLPYGPINPLGGASQCMAGPLCQQVDDGIDAPFHVQRCDDMVGNFVIGNDDPAVMPLSDSPGAANPCIVCGDGMVGPGEDCDDMGESATCDADCTTAMCGDGVVNITAGEACDDAGESAACNADCSAASCGDGIINMTAGESCDGDGMGMGGETALCDSDCTSIACGDGIVNMTGGEDCDDGGESATCDTDCTTAMCGDMVVNTTAGETCDDGGRTDMCDADCTAVSCGDGVVNVTAGEECDGDGMGMGGETDTCDDDCTNAMCGDMVVNATAGEECDDGEQTEDCDDDCTVAECGDGIVNSTAGEECDGDGRGTGGETDACNDDCTPASCGDGIVNAAAGEDCDDRFETEDCDANCTVAECGDGTTNAIAGEECDDGNNEPGDGCDPECNLEGMVDTGDSGDSGSGGMDGTTTSDAGTSADNTGDGTEDTEGTGDTDSGGVVVPGDGCSCSSDHRQQRAPWSVLALLGLGALGRRRRRRR